MPYATTYRAGQHTQRTRSAGLERSVWIGRALLWLFYTVAAVVALGLVLQAMAGVLPCLFVVPPTVGIIAVACVLKRMTS